MGNRGLHMPVSGVASALNGHLRSMVRMAYVTQIKGRDGWYMRYRGANGRYKFHKGGETKGEAEINLALRTSKIAVVRAGLVSRQTYELAEHAQRPIGDHLKLYVDSLKGRRRTPHHVLCTERMIAVWIAGCDVQTLDDVSPVRTETWLSEMLDVGKSYRTRNAYFKAARGFLNWCVKHGRLPANPLLSIPVLNEKEDRRAPSRAMTVQQFEALTASCGDDKRRLWYLLAGRMGLRWGEIGRLRWLQFDLKGAWLQLDDKDTKNRRGDALPIPSDVLKELRKLGPSGGRLFEQKPTMRTWLADLVRAGIVTLKKPKLPQAERYVDDNMVGYREEGVGQYDRKSLRKTFGTHLAKAGVDLRIAQRLMRHSDPKLTSMIYTDPVLLDMRGAVDRATPALHETPAQNVKSA